MALLNVLVVNAGSTGLKLSVVGESGAARAIGSLEDVDAEDVRAVGHRVVHGGEQFTDPVVVDDETVRALARVAELAPLHNGPAIEAIEAAQHALPGAVHVAVFDTAFHRTIPDVARTYPLPARFRERGIRRYGFHGLSVQWAAELLPVSRLVVCHLGGGSSVTAVRDGLSVDTTMGFTPLEGVPMATRAGSVDPGLLLYLLRHGVSLEELDHALEYESGLTALAGTGDASALEHDPSPEAQLALDLYCYRVAQAVSAMATALGGLDVLAFTAGVGEHSARVRAGVCDRLGHIGVALDSAANASASGDAEIGDPSAIVRVHVVHAREDAVVARAVRALLAQHE